MSYTITNYKTKKGIKRCCGKGVYIMQEIYQFINELHPATLFITGVLALGLCWVLDKMSN